MEPGGRRPAPGTLARVQAFVNTLDVEDGVDQLTDPGQLRVWLTERELLDHGERLGAADLQRAVEVREALRGLLRTNAGGGVDAEAVASLNRTARNARLLVQFAGDGRAGLEPEPAGVEQAVARLLAIVYTAMAEGTWARLKACRNQECQWAYYDHSKNRSGHWCTMDQCGNAMKARAYRRRRARRDAPRP
jgi:predicted RNA-binding Zn ribbon-like protein